MQSGEIEIKNLKAFKESICGCYHIIEPEYNTLNNNRYVW